MKVLSSEIVNMSVADAVHGCEQNSFHDLGLSGEGLVEEPDAGRKLRRSPRTLRESDDWTPRS